MDIDDVAERVEELVPDVVEKVLARDDGALVPDGVYFYILTIGDRQMTGHVELLR